MDDEIRIDIIFALSRHIKPARPGNADEVCMIAAADILRHLRLRGWKIERDVQGETAAENTPSGAVGEATYLMTLG